MDDLTQKSPESSIQGAKQTLETPHPQGEKLQTKRKNPVPGENLEDHREELECQRSAKTAVLTPVLGILLEDLRHRPTTTGNWIVDDLLGTLLLEQGKRQSGRKIHQLFRHLRTAQITVHQTLLNAVLCGFGHVDNLLDR